MEIILWLHNNLFFSAVALSSYFNKISAKYQQKENQSIKVCIFVLHKQFSRSKSKNGQLRPIIHELKCHLHFPLRDTFVIITYRESICLQICPFASERKIMFLFKLSHPCPKYCRVARTAISCFLWAQHDDKADAILPTSLCTPCHFVWWSEVFIILQRILILNELHKILPKKFLNKIANEVPVLAMKNVFWKHRRNICNLKLFIRNWENSRSVSY